MSEFTEVTLSDEGIHAEVMTADLPYYLGYDSIVKTYISQSPKRTCWYNVRSSIDLVRTVVHRMKLGTDNWMSEMERRGGYVAYIRSIAFKSRPTRAELYASVCRWQLEAEAFLLQGETPRTQVGPTNRNDLGRGSFGVVQEVVVLPASPNSVKMARKRISLWRPRKAEINKFLQLVKDEVANLKSLDHPHIISLLGCYEENIGTTDHTFNLLMHPVCDGDLSMLLHNVENLEPEYNFWSLRWFMCLLSALAHIHSKGIRHEDIKPQNIVHRDGRLFLTDFSSARKFKLDGVTSTENPAIATRLYAAPEAMQDLQTGKLGRHGLKSDVYSLGLVFVEMNIVLRRKSLDEFHDWLEKEHAFGTGQRKEYHRVAHAFGSWFDGFPSHYWSVTLWNDCIRKMLEPERSKRPSAAESLRALRERTWHWGTNCDCLDMTF